jgi:Cu/Ag efflux protein CusF
MTLRGKDDSIPREMSQGTRRRVWSLLLPALALGLVAAPAASQNRTVAEGRVVAVDLRRGSVTLEHEAIPGIGPAATTEFPAEPPELVRAVRVGDAVHFTVQPAEGSHGLLTVSALDPDREPAGAAPRGVGGTWSERLLVGGLSALLVAVSALAYAGWHFARRLRAELRQTGRAQEALHTDVLAVTRATMEIAEALREKYLRDLHRRFEAAQAARAAMRTNGRAGDESPSKPGLLVVVSREGPTLAATDELVRVFQERLGGADVVPIVRDRRVGERRRARASVDVERRHVERRGPVPGTWLSLGFILSPVRARPSRGGAPTAPPRAPDPAAQLARGSPSAPTSG